MTEDPDSGQHRSGKESSTEEYNEQERIRREVVRKSEKRSSSASQVMLRIMCNYRIIIHCVNVHFLSSVDGHLSFQFLAVRIGAVVNMDEQMSLQQDIGSLGYAQERHNWILKSIYSQIPKEPH